MKRWKADVKRFKKEKSDASRQYLAATTEARKKRFEKQIDKLYLFISKLKSEQPLMSYHNKDIVTAPAAQAIAHCVSECQSQSAGAARAIVEAYPANQTFPHTAVGNVAHVFASGRHIFNLITKKLYNEKPTYGTLRDCLKELRAHVLALGITKLAITPLGCGRDKLLWLHVEKHIKAVFKNDEVEIHVYVLCL